MNYYYYINFYNLLSFLFFIYKIIFLYNIYMSAREIFKASKDANIETQRVLVPAINGNSFTENQKINFDIPANHKFVSLRECNLHFDVECPINPDGVELPEAGAQRLIKSVKIMEKSTGRAIETINQYNVLATNQYHYSLTSGEKCSRSLTELAAPEPNNTNNQTLNNQFLQPYNSTPQSSAKKKLKQRIVLKLWSKVFDNYGDDSVYPNIFAPLQIQVELEKNKRALKSIDLLNHDTTSIAAGKACILDTTVPAAPVTSIIIQNDAARGVDGNTNNMQGCPFTVGGSVRLSESGKVDSDMTGTITAITLSATKYVLAVVGVAAAVYTGGVAHVTAIPSSLATSTYLVTNPAIEVNVCNVPSEWEDQLISLVSDNEFRYNFKAIDNVQVNQTSGNTNYVNYVNSNSPSVSACLVIPTNSETADSIENDLITGQYLAIDNYNFHYNNSNNPSLPVPTTKLNSSKVSQQHLHELMKCNENFWGTKNLVSFKDDFAVGRSFGVHSSAMMLTNKDLSVRFACISGSSLTNNQMYNHYLVNNKTLVVNRDGVTFV